MIPRRQALTLALLLCIAARAETQTLSRAQTTELVREAVASLSEQSQATHRFTYYELAHTQNRNEKGKLLYDRTTLIETTYIADLPFERVLEVDGKPLSGKALVAEQARYDRAIRDRTALDTEARSRIEKLGFINAAIPYSQLTTRFRLADLRQEAVPTLDSSVTARVIEGNPIPSADPALPTLSRHILLWIAPAAPTTPPHLMRADFDYITPDTSTAGEIEPGSHGSILYTQIDGFTVPAHKEIHSRIAAGPSHTRDKPLQVDVERTYSRYRQFTSTTRILPVDAAAPSPR